MRGIVVDYDTAEGFRVVYRTEGLVGFDYVEMLSAHEMDRRLEQQEHLHLVQSELATQRTMDALELGKHLAKNLDNVLALLQDKLDAIREQQQRIVHSRELEAELSTVKSTYRIGRRPLRSSPAQTQRPSVMASAAGPSQGSITELQ